MLAISSTTVPRIVRRFASKWEWRHVRVISTLRVFVAIWFAFLGAMLCRYGYWWGAFLFVAAGFTFWIAYQMPRWKRALDAEGR